MSTSPRAGAPAEARAGAAAPATQPSLMDQLAELQITELNGTVLGTTLSLKQPIIAKGLAGLVEHH